MNKYYFGMAHRVVGVVVKNGLRKLKLRMFQNELFRFQCPNINNKLKYLHRIEMHPYFMSKQTVRQCGAIHNINKIIIGA